MRVACKERVRPGSPAEAPAKHSDNCTQQNRQVKARRSLRWFTDRELSQKSPCRSTDDVVEVRCVKGLRQQADERHGWRERVADRRVAAFRIPAIEAIGLEPEPDDTLAPTREGQRRRRDLH